MDTELQGFLQSVLIGLTIGGYLALIALGYTMVYGIIELINFAHGDLVAFGFFISLTFFDLVFPKDVEVPLSGNNLYVVLPAVFLVTMLVTGGLNILIEQIAYRPLRGSSRLAPLLTAVGVSFVLEASFALWKGGQQVPYPRYFPSTNLMKLGIGILDGKSINQTLDALILFTTKDFFLFLATIPLVTGLALFIDRTRLGKAMRACAQDREAAAMMGINVNWIITLTFFIGGALAGAAGMILGLYLNTGRFTMGFDFGLFAFTAAVLGGIGNIRGAVLGAFIIGMLKSMSDTYVGSEWTRVVVFGVLILLLVFRPSGILGSTQGIEKI